MTYNYNPQLKLQQQRPASYSFAPSYPPPNMPLPPLPVSKTRIRLTDDTTISPDQRRGSSSSLPPTPNASRSATPSSLSTLHTTGIPQQPSGTRSAEPLSAKSPLSALKTPNRPISVSAFPQPPKSTIPRSSNSPSPISTPASSTTNLNALTGQNATRTRNASPQSGGHRKPIRRTSGLSQSSRAPSTTAQHSPLSDIGEGQTLKTGIPNPALLNIPSPPESPTSSAHGSAKTDGTHFEDVDSEPTHKEKLQPADTVSVKSSKSMKDAKGNVLVSVRVRPDAPHVDASKVEAEWTVDGRRAVVRHKRGESGEFKYDNVFTTNDHNSKVYDSAAKRLVRRVMEGYHGTVFAYGMTGTGKTFSMQGTAQSPGVIPLAITDIFSYIRENPEREFLLRVSYLEIYNERIYDLLSADAGGVGGVQQEEIKLREDSKRGVYAAPLKEEIVQSPTQLLRVIARGDMARRTGSTQFNARSSRSHAVVQIVVESRARAGGPNGSTDKLPEGVLISTLSLIDLAGSEKAAENKERRTEGSHINKSLLTLGTVISRLSSLKDPKTDDKHLPFRDSKLTRLLQPALSGNSLVSILCTVQLSSIASAAIANTSETLNTLNFASRAKNNIVSHAKRNESHPAHVGGAAALLDRYRLEIEDLKRQLEEQNQTKDEVERVEEEEERWREREREAMERHEEQMLEMQLARTALKERIGHLNRLILSSKSVGVNASRFSVETIRRASTFGPDAVGVALGSPDASRQSSLSTIEPPAPLTPRRAISFGSAVHGVMPAARVSQIAIADDASDYEEPGSAGTEGDASLAQQVRALQADLADKNRYISTLEKRLLQTRRTSHSRPSLPTTQDADPEREEAIREKDREIESLRAKLDDQTRMVNALRSAARKLDNGRRASGVAVVSEDQHPLPPPSTMLNRSVTAPVPTTTTTPASRPQTHRSNPSSSSSTGGKSVNFSRLTPVSILSPSRSEGHLPKAQHTTHSNGGSGTDGSKVMGRRSLRRQKSVEHMTRLLDEMISQRVVDNKAGHGHGNGTGNGHGHGNGDDGGAYGVTPALSWGPGGLVGKVPPLPV